MTLDIRNCCCMDLMAEFPDGYFVNVGVVFK